MKEVEAARMTPLLKAAHSLTLFLSTVFNGSIASTLSGNDCGFSEILIVERFMADENTIPSMKSLLHRPRIPLHLF